MFGNNSHEQLGYPFNYGNIINDPIPILKDGQNICIFTDYDRDGVDDLLRDNCPEAFNPDQSDRDDDGYADACDNCPFVYNPNQRDYDNDGIGNRCPKHQSCDLNGNGRADLADAIRCLKIASNGDSGGPINKDYALGHNGQFGIDEAAFILQKIAR